MSISKNKLKSEIRKDYFLNKFVIITPSRSLRPRDINEQTILKRNNTCPFCPENINPKIIIDKINNRTKQWEVISIANIFPAVSLDNSFAYGVQEVIIETRNHSQELAELSLIEIENVLKMYAKRTLELMKNKKLDYILCFKNQGSRAGASIIHAHSQVFATAIIPPDISNEMLLAQDYKNKNKNCVYCDIIKKEQKEKIRIVFEDKNIIAFTPYASEYHYEVWIFPKRHLDNITLLKKEEISSLSSALKKILTKLEKLKLSFNYFLHNVVSNTDQHFYIKIQPRDSIWAGVELGSGLVINSVSPEDASEFYNQ